MRITPHSRCRPLSRNSEPLGRCSHLKLAAELCLLACSLALAGQRSYASQDPNILAAEDYMKQKNFAKAVEALELAISLDPRCDPEAYLMLATSRVNLGEKGKAIEATEKGLDLFPKSARLQNYFVSLLKVAAPKDAARVKLEQRLSQQPDSPPYLKALGELLMNDDPTNPRAEELLAAAAKKAPRDAEAHYLHGKLACVNDKAELCIAELSKAYALAPANHQAGMQIFTMIGMAQNDLGHAEEAEAAFKKALQFNQTLNSPSPYATLQYAVFLGKRGRDTEAQSRMEDILKRAPDYAPAHFEYAKLLAKQRKWEQAAKEAELALSHSGNDRTELRAIHAFLAKTYFALGRVQDAKVHEEWVEYTAVHFDRAKQLAGEGKMTEAIMEAELALENASNDMNQLRAIRAFLVKTYYALGRPQDAKVHEDWLRAHP